MVMCLQHIPKWTSWTETTWHCSNRQFFLLISHQSSIYRTILDVINSRVCNDKIFSSITWQYLKKCTLPASCIAATVGVPHVLITVDSVSNYALQDCVLDCITLDQFQLNAIMIIITLGNKSPTMAITTVDESRVHMKIANWRCKCRSTWWMVEQ